MFLDDYNTLRGHIPDHELDLSEKHVTNIQNSTLLGKTMQPPRTWFIGLSGCEKEGEVDILNDNVFKRNAETQSK